MHFDKIKYDEFNDDLEKVCSYLNNLQEMGLEVLEHVIGWSNGLTHYVKFSHDVHVNVRSTGFTVYYRTGTNKMRELCWPSNDDVNQDESCVINWFETDEFINTGSYTRKVMLSLSHDSFKKIRRMIS